MYFKFYDVDVLTNLKEVILCDPDSCIRRLCLSSPELLLMIGEDLVDTKAGQCCIGHHWLIDGALARLHTVTVYVSQHSRILL